MALKEATRSEDLGWVPSITDDEFELHYQCNSGHYKLDGMMAKHVDDIKLAGILLVIEALLYKLYQIFGELKQEWYTFMNTGIQHTLLPDGTMTMDQDAYIQTIKPIRSPLLKRSPPTMNLDRDLHGQFWSLLGVIGFTTMTQAWISIYVQALQRKARAPKMSDLKALNKVAKALKAGAKKIIYRPMWCDKRLDAKRLGIPKGRR